jgi:uncharacterized protein (DUF983 family)
MELKCKFCGHSWNYLGKSAFKATCSQCGNKILFFNKENLKYAKTITCAYCKRTVVKHKSQIKYCSVRCAARAAQPLGTESSAKNDQRGEKGHNWKGGISNNSPHYSKLQLLRYPERIKCRKFTQSLKDRGILIPSPNCEECGNDVKLHAHHEDYTNPFEVKWLCRPCHRAIHGGTH